MTQWILRVTETGDLAFSSITNIDDAAYLAGRFPSNNYFVVNIDTDITPPHLCYTDPYKPHRPDKDCA